MKYLFQRCQHDFSNSIRVTDADFIIGEADKVAVLFMSLGELLILVPINCDAEMP